MNKATGTMVEGGQKISEKVREGMTHIESGSRAIQAAIDKAIEGMETAIKEAGNNLTNVAADAFKQQQAHVQQLSDSIANQLSQTTHAHDALIKGQNQQMQQLFAGLKQAMGEATTAHNNLIKAELSKIDETMQSEIERVMQLMANNLASITKKFVDDYTVLTGHMNQVVQQSKRFN